MGATQTHDIVAFFYGFPIDPMKSGAPTLSSYAIGLFNLEYEDPHISNLLPSPLVPTIH